MSDEGKWCYSFNGENFEGNFDTMQQAIDEAMSEYEDGELDQDFIWVGQVKEISLDVNVDLLLDQLGEQAYEQAGEYAEDFLSDVTLGHQKVLAERLDNVLHEWMKEFRYKPNFWSVNNVTKIVVNG